MGIIFESETNIGNKRQVNEDSLWPKTNHHPYQPDEPFGMLFIVADGMGGHGSGDVASELAVKEISTTYYSLGNDYPRIEDRLKVAIAAAHQQICQQAADNPALENMGSTVVAAVVKYDEIYEQGEVWVAWAGDSRVYLLRRGQLQQLTRDHSRVWPLIASGQITWDQLRFHPERSRVTNGLTARRAEVIPEIERFDLEPGDQILLCSDGLPGEVRPEEIERILAASTHEQALPLLIAKANAPKEVLKDGQRVRLEGGNDNISSILINIPTGNAKTAALPALPVIEKPAPAKSSRLGCIIGGVLMGVILVGVGLFLFFINWNGAVPVETVADASPPPATPTEVPPTASIAVAVIAPTATSTSQPTATALPSTPILDETRAPTSTRGPTFTPSPTVTFTPIPPTATPSLTATPTLTTALDSAAFPPPILIEPKPQADFVKGRDITFVWQWQGGELPEKFGFEVLIWLGENYHAGTYGVKELKSILQYDFQQNQYSVTFPLAGEGITTTDANYFWSVGIVQVEPYERLKNTESDPRSISIVVPLENK